MRSIVPVILAAGDSSRMGYPKALLEIDGQTFITHILQTIEKLDLLDAYVILGRHSDRVRSAIDNSRLNFLINPDPGRGQSSSIQLAVTNLPRQCDGALIWPVDQPSVSETVVSRLIGLFYETRASLVLPCCGGRRGHPAIFNRALFGELLAEPPQKGLKELVLRHQAETRMFETDEAGTVEDIDTPEDYFRLTGKKPPR